MARDGGGGRGGGDAPEGGARSWLRRRPWIWIVVLFVFVLLFNIAMLIIALANQPTSVR